ncbi:MAG: c-type cytochrome [Rhodanobacteraceae bacterium]
MYVKSRRPITVAALLFGALLASGPVMAANDQAATSSNDPFRAAEAWAFPVFPPPPDPHAPKPDPHKVLHVTGSAVSYTQAQMDSMDDADWFPQDHPPAPHIVEVGRKPAHPCAECHLISGTGVPATASLDGLPKAYILEQIAAFRAGERGMGGPATAHDMVEEARALNPADLQQAVDYFHATKFVPRVHVVETASVPKTRWKYFVRVPDKGGAREPIGQRIIETPVNFSDYALSDGRVAYVAYVPPGSIAAGAKIASQGVGTAPACESCHGAKLQGVGNIPYLAGRSPTYIVRELILFREGKRTNPGAAPMRAEVSHLTLNDVIDVAAYAASR